MSQDWYLIKPPRIYNSGFEEKEFDSFATDGFDELLASSPLSVEVTIYNDTVFKDGFKTDVVIQNVTTDNINNDTIRQILCRIGTLKAGMYIKYKNRYWLIVTLPDDNKIYEKAIIMCCNHYLQWRNENEEIVGRYCIVEDGTKYSVGEKVNLNNVILGDTRINIRIPRDEETLKFKRGKRFLISNTSNNPTAYKLTIFDDVTDYFGNNNGIVNLICTEDRFNDLTDNPDLMIADYYYEPTNYTLKLLNYDSVLPLALNVDSYFTLEILALKNGDSAEFGEVKYLSSDKNIATIDKNGIIHAVADGECGVSISYASEQIVLQVNVKSESVVDEYNVSILDVDNDSEIMYGDSNEVYIQYYKNGDSDIDYGFECELIDADNIAEIQETTLTSITILTFNNKKNINKTFSLRVWNSVLGVEDIKQFKVVGYF